MDSWSLYLYLTVCIVCIVNYFVRLITIHVIKIILILRSWICDMDLHTMLRFLVYLNRSYTFGYMFTTVMLKLIMFTCICKYVIVMFAISYMLYLC